VAVISSGTATIEAALQQTPFLVVYKLSPLTYRVARALVKGVRYFAMVNLVAGKKLVEELLQEEASAERIAQELEILLGDPGRRQAMREELAVVRRKLGVGLNVETTSAERAARSILEVVEHRKKITSQV
jgi:lipid-A-disaccharide synthase